MEEKLEKWRLILGQKSDPSEQVQLKPTRKKMDDVLEALYDSDRKGGLGSSSPNINRWLGDIRNYFPTSVVQVMQRDAIDNLGLTQLLLEPELLDSIEPDVHLAATLLSLNKVMPEKTKDTARRVVEKVVRDLEKKLKKPLQEAIEGALKRTVRNHRPKPNEIDWHKTIRANLKHYQKDLGTIIPEKLIGYGKMKQSLKHIVLMMDQSGSMAASVVYGAVFGAVLASLKSLKTQLIAFDTEVVDLSKHLDDPVELLFGTQLGGGTDIQKAVAYADQIIGYPSETIVILISDLYEGGSHDTLIKRIAALQSKGVQFISLLALSDEGAPSFDRNMANRFADLGIHAFACTPDLFPDLMAAAD
ncbi:MAG: VWA domain-containing protein [Saprospiraceae bacterium]